MTYPVSNRNQTVKLSCPTVTKTTIEIAVYDDHKIDIGFISQVFGLDPHTVKLNGYFISRGLDLVSLSVTWRSLLSFFYSRGFCTGRSDSEAIVVHGKLKKAGTKRAQELEDTENEKDYPNSVTANLRIQFEDFNLVKNKKLKGNSSGYIDRNYQFNSSNGFSLKRKRHQEDFSPLKILIIE